MNLSQEKIMKERLSEFNGKWIAKKSRNPFGEKAPAFFFRAPRHDKKHHRFFIRNDGKSFPVCTMRVNQLEIISKEEAKRVNKLFWESNKLLKDLPVSDDICIRQETKEPKKRFSTCNFQNALYTLKRKYPDKICSAYVCPVCGFVHLGKK